MAVLYVTEYDYLPEDNNANKLPLGDAGRGDQTVAITSSTVQGTAFSGTTTFVEIHTDAICHIALGSNPSATTSNMRLAADERVYRAVEPSSKIAVIAGT